MISSTNLVVELGIVMLVLLGWQFAVAEFVGGPVMITLLALIAAVSASSPHPTTPRRPSTCRQSPSRFAREMTSCPRARPSATLMSLIRFAGCP